MSAHPQPPAPPPAPPAPHPTREPEQPAYQLQPAFTPNIPGTSQPAPDVKNRWDNDQAFITWMQTGAYSFPGSVAGDPSFTDWCYSLWQGAGGAKTQAHK